MKDSTNLIDLVDFAPDRRLNACLASIHCFPLACVEVAKRKNPAAVALGRKGGSVSGIKERIRGDGA